MKRTSRSPEAAGRFLNGLGLAAKAGRMRIGLDAVRRSIRAGEATVVVVATDAPENVRRKLSGLLSSRDLPELSVLDGDRLGRAVGRERVVVLAITDKSLGRRVVELAAAAEG